MDKRNCYLLSSFPCWMVVLFLVVVWLFVESVVLGGKSWLIVPVVVVIVVLIVLIRLVIASLFA